MVLTPHIAALAVTTVGIGWGMMVAGVNKNALEWRRRRRICPSCGRRIEARLCRTCIS
jgi:hypothetical protein